MFKTLVKLLALTALVTVMPCAPLLANESDTFSSTLSQSDRRSITIGVGEAGYPLSVNNKDTQTVDGILPDLVRETLQKMGYADVQVRAMPYHRLTTALNNGDIDVANLLNLHHVIVQSTPSASTCTDDPIMTMPISIHAINDSAASKPRIGHLLPHNTSMMTPTLAKANIHEFSTHYLREADDLYKSLIKQRIDLAISSDVLANYWSNQLNTRFYKVKQLSEVNFHLCFSEVNFELAQIERLKRDFIVALPSINVDMISHAHGAIPMVSGPVDLSPTHNDFNR